MIVELDIQAGLEHLADHRGQQPYRRRARHPPARARSTSSVAHSHICGPSRIRKSSCRHQPRRLSFCSLRHGHDPSQPAALSRGPSDHAVYTKFLTVPSRLLAGVEFVSNVAGRATVFTYDANGRLSKTEEQVGGVVKLTTTTTVDANTGRLNDKKSVAGNLTFDEVPGYDLAGRQTSIGEGISGASSSLIGRAASYDGLGRLREYSQTGSAGNVGRRYDYDANTNRTRTCTSSSVPTNYSGCATPLAVFDGADRVTSSPGVRVCVRHAWNITSFTRTGVGVVSFSYDEYDHATVMNDGVTKTEEWFPSGRVLHRKVTTVSSGTVTRSVFGYSGGGDSPAWSQPAAGGTVTSFVGGAVIVGSSITFNATNVHGDVIGTVNAAGVMSLVVTADEFGRGGTPPSSRLGWLGGSARFTVAPALGIVRMGVRLYDPEIGRAPQPRIR